MCAYLTRKLSSQNIVTAIAAALFCFLYEHFEYYANLAADLFFVLAPKLDEQSKINVLIVYYKAASITMQTACRTTVYRHFVSFYYVRLQY